MKYEYLKITQIVILSLVAIYQQNPYIYIGTLIYSFLTNNHQNIITICISTGLISITLFWSLQIWKFVFIGIILAINLLILKYKSQQKLNIKYIVPVVLLTISFTSINDNLWIRQIHLVVFLYFLLLSYYLNYQKMKISLYIGNCIWLIEGTVFSIQKFVEFEKLNQQQSIVSQNKQWWYFLCFPIIIQCSAFILQNLKNVANNVNPVQNNQHQQNKDLLKVPLIQKNQQVQIQMKDLSIKKKSQPNNSISQSPRKQDHINEQITPPKLQQKQSNIEEYFKNIQLKTDHQQSKQKQRQNKQFPLLSLYQQQKQRQEQQQSQSLNLILIIPFLLQNSGILQLPLYIYAFSIHYNFKSSLLYFVMIFSAFLIIFFQEKTIGIGFGGDDNIEKSNGQFQKQQQQQYYFQQTILLRIAIVLLVNKNIHVLNEMAQIIKKIWSKSSFVFVLAFLFWFSLKTVNIFHIILTIILLLFITIQNQKNQYSYRHKNWVFLLTGFNIFLFMRQIYAILLHYKIYKPSQSSSYSYLFQNVLDLIGLSYKYQSQLQYFNFIPYVISVLIAFQYLTYQSKVYNQVRQRSILPLYQRTINQIIKLLTIVYYKLIPWISYIFIYFVLLSLEFSCTSLLLLIWLSFCLGIQVEKKNCLDTYKLMYKLWNVLERLFAVQIILRYTFQFLNFPLFYNFFHQFPIFITVQKYKQFLGLAIRQADYVYFKTITKFQLMVGLDFACIFICFLVIQYYMYLISYLELSQQQQALPSQQQQFRQKQIIKQIYTKFIDFKLTLYFKKFTLVLKYFAKIYLWIYYPALGLFCCFYPSGIGLIYLLICILFYVKKNSQSYEKFIKENLILRVKEMFLLWKQEQQEQQLIQRNKMKQSNILENQQETRNKRSSLKIRLYNSAKGIYSSIIQGKKHIRFDSLLNFQSFRKWVIFVSAFAIIMNYASRVFELQETLTLFEENANGQANSFQVGQFENPFLLKFRWILFVGGVSIDSQINIVCFLIILASTIFEVKCTRFLLKLYDVSVQKLSQEMNNVQQNYKKINQAGEADYRNEDQKKDDQHMNKLITSRNRYENLLQSDDYDLKELKRQIQEIQELNDTDMNLQLQKNIEKLKSQQNTNYEKQNNRMNSSRKFSQQFSNANMFRKRKDSIAYKGRQRSVMNEKNDPVDNEQNDMALLQLKISKEQLKKFIQMKVSLLQGLTKFIQRCFVMILVFLSIVQNRHPFSIIYLICSVALTFIGAYSILSLSRIIAILIFLQYTLLICNYSNYNLTSTQSFYPQFKQLYQSQHSFDFLTIFGNGTISPQWSQYIQFGDTPSQVIMMILSYIVLFLYQVYFSILNISWQKILLSVTKKISLTKIQKRIYEYSNLLYTYFLIYSPLFITICSLGIYLLDFTITNLFLTIVSIMFLFKSVLVEEYYGSRQFWRLYFYILQFFIVIFMLIYDILSIPMYQKYCIKILCSSEEFHTKVYKAGLLFVLQIGIDLTKSTYFITALDNLKIALNSQTLYSKLAIAYKQNDRKINKKFRELDQQKSLQYHLTQVQQFLQKYKSKPQATYENKQQIQLSSDSWMDLLIQILPSFVDATLVLTSKQAKQFIQRQNEYFLKYQSIQQEQDLSTISQKYLNQFGQIQTYEQLMNKIKNIKQQIVSIYQNQQQQMKYLTKNFSQQQAPYGYQSSLDHISLIRKSFSQNRIPYEPSNYYKERLQEVRDSLITINDKSEKQKIHIWKQQKKKLIFLLILESIVSNWHYLTYFLLIIEHLFNMGLLTLPFPFFAFIYGLVYPYQAPKNIWRIYFLLILIPIGFKFALAIQLIPSIDQNTIHLLIGDNRSSILIEYLIIMFVLIQCLILKIIGLYDQGVTQVQCMKIAIIRNIINNNNQTQISHLSYLLKQSLTIPQKSIQYIFLRSQQKQGYSYTTLMTSLQLTSLIYVFFCYDQMAIRKQVTIYQMISYNQFTAGMVVLTLIQLAFILVQRFLNITNFKQYSQKWQLNLIIKYAVLIMNILYVELLVLLFFPYNSNNFTENSYIYIFFIINALIFLVSALQIKYGIDQKSKGFMDRYTWYNGFIYMGFRAVPFLFQFKVFSDWTFTKTALRLFDWIKLEEIFGRMYIAKCNAIFLSTKIIGSKIQWWKKLLMGVPLLFAIILLIFGPLILFSSINPLASKNSISAGYLQLCLKINRTNQYVFYTNSHITDIFQIVPNQRQKQLLQSYDIQQDTVQIVNLQEYSDQYWQISQGSYIKLLEQSKDSLHEIVIRMKFQRNQTGTTPTYTLGNYQIKSNQIDNFKKTLQGQSKFVLKGFLNNFLRLDNNNGIHELGDEKLNVTFYAQQAKKNNKKKYWIIQNGLKIKIASDKYTKAIFGYSVMSFYISIILVIANYFRFLFQGSANTIILNDIPFADPVLSLCNGVYKARYYGDTQTQQRLFWLIIDLLRSPDQIKSLTGNYIQARIQTKKLQLQKQQQKLLPQYQQNHPIISSVRSQIQHHQHQRQQPIQQQTNPKIKKNN